MIIVFIGSMSGCQTMANETTYQKVILDVPYIDQVEKYPTGCESVSATMLLNHYHIDITVEDFIDIYLDKGSHPYEDNNELVGANPWQQFVGDPYQTTGYGCYSPVILNAFNDILNANKYLVLDLSHHSLQDICHQYIDQGIPVLIWATIDMKQPSEGRTWRIAHSQEYFTWIKPEHCLVLTGYDKFYYYFNDPLQHQNTAYPKAKVEIAYQGLYEQAITIVKR